MSYVFISGIPAAGKSHLAKKVADATGARHVEIDNWREELALSSPELNKWVNFFAEQNSAEYYRTTTCEKQWENLKNQSEAIWPEILKRIREIQASGEPAIFEGVNILPHLARRDLNFDGIFLLGDSVETIFERNKKDPRWGETEEMQRVEAEAFFNCEGAMYEKEAHRYDYRTFRTSHEAEQALLATKVTGVTFILLRPSGEMLMQLRDGNSKRFPHTWCFPGGTPEFGEDYIDTVVREIYEEYGLEVLPADCREILEYTLPYGATRSVSAKVFLCGVAENQEPVLREGADMKWMKIDEVKKLELGFFQQEIILTLENILKK